MTLEGSRPAEGPPKSQLGCSSFLHLTSILVPSQLPCHVSGSYPSLRCTLPGFIAHLSAPTPVLLPMLPAAAGAFLLRNLPWLTFRVSLV